MSLFLRNQTRDITTAVLWLAISKNHIDVARELLADPEEYLIPAPWNYATWTMTPEMRNLVEMERGIRTAVLEGGLTPEQGRDLAEFDAALVEAYTNVGRSPMYPEVLAIYLMTHNTVCAKRRPEWERLVEIRYKQILAKEWPGPNYGHTEKWEDAGLGWCTRDMGETSRVNDFVGIATGKPIKRSFIKYH